MDTNRKIWNEGQQNLRRTLAAGDLTKAIEQFLTQHAMVHSKKVSRADVWSFEDELWQGLTEKAFRTIPPKGGHSIAWILFHIARIEDITMNMLVAGNPQIYIRDKWAKKLKSTIHHSANRMDNESVAQLSSQLELTALREYRAAVGRGTRDIVRKIRPHELNQKVDTARLQTVLDQGAVIPEAMEIVHYWGNRTIAGLLLMPPTRHNFLHLNEAFRVKKKV
ncbi:DinB family protein [Candidatus Villigracilis affinis]|uniref:DinB family protein n=1 Tax=Candidatus Villigracilis affinis TaxID=3140682 RepID=UPI001D28976F|nr:DinB family protein [Anaerolineales bacterium]